MFRHIGNSFRFSTVLLLAAAVFLNAKAAELPVPEVQTGGPGASRAQLLKLNPPSAPRGVEPINDLALLQHLETVGAKLVQSGGTLTNWTSQLYPRTCLLQLPKPGSRKAAPAALAKRVEAATAVVGVCYLCGKCSKLHFTGASGFFVNDTGALVTCLHVLANNQTNGIGIVAMTRDGRLAPVKAVLAVDPLHDLVVLQAEGRGFPFLPLAKRDAEPGSPVIVVSNPSGHYYAISTGVVARRSEQVRPGGRFHSLSITADFAKGSSGAPVCDETGAVIGVVNNTESIYYNLDHDQQQNFQMSVKNCSPVGELLRLVGKRPAK
jgi:S1-C subfamily serine protease